MDGADVTHEALVEQSPDALIFADRAGLILLWNGAAERIFGYPGSRAIGQSLDIIVPEQFRDAHWTGYRRAIAEGETKYFGQAMPTRAVRAGGEEIYVELSFSIVRGEDGGVVGALAAARDITERWERDRAERRRVRDLEASLEELRGDPPR